MHKRLAVLKNWARLRLFCLTDCDVKKSGEQTDGAVQRVEDHLEDIAKSISMDQDDVGHILVRRSVENYLPPQDFLDWLDVHESVSRDLRKRWEEAADAPVQDAGAQSTKEREFLAALALLEDCDPTVWTYLDFCKGNASNRTDPAVWSALSSRQQSVLVDGFKKKRLAKFFEASRGLQDSTGEFHAVIKTIRERM